MTVAGLHPSTSNHSKFYSKLLLCKWIPLDEQCRMMAPLLLNLWHAAQS